jgi:hypothetical protein
MPISKFVYTSDPDLIFLHAPEFIDLCIYVEVFFVENRWTGD